MRPLGQMNPKNYREWSANVNLISHKLSSAVSHWSDVCDIAFGPVRDLSCAPFNGASICLIANDFSRNYHGSLTPKFTILKPRFWRQKYENQDQHTQYIPLP